MKFNVVVNDEFPECNGEYIITLYGEKPLLKDIALKDIALKGLRKHVDEHYFSAFPEVIEDIKAFRKQDVSLKEVRDYFKDRRGLTFKIEDLTKYTYVNVNNPMQTMTSYEIGKEFYKLDETMQYTPSRIIPTRANFIAYGNEFIRNDVEKGLWAIQTK